MGLLPVVQDKVLVTMHRRENHHNMKEWFETINNIAKENSDLQFILPLHPNPNVSKHKRVLTDVAVVDPMSYEECIETIRTCKAIITDSGGIQEESSFLKKKCIVCRKVSERHEGVGTFAFMCANPKELKPKFDSIIKSQEFIVNEECPYGDGHAAQKILGVLQDEICCHRR